MVDKVIESYFDKINQIEHSSQISKVAFKNNRMLVEFKGKFNGCYVYPEIKEETFDSLIKSESIGSAFYKMKGSLTKFIKHEYGKDNEELVKLLS